MLVIEDRIEKLLLISCSTIYGRGYLDHVEGEIRDLLKGVQSVVFIPFALHDREAYSAKAAEQFQRMGVTLTEDSTSRRRC